MKITKQQITSLKKSLSNLSQPELIELVVESYMVNEEIQDIIQLKLTDMEVQGADEQPAGVISLAAMKLWLEIPEDFRAKIIRNVFCGNCGGETTIQNFNVRKDKYGILLEGTCIKCNHRVARVVENS